MGEKAISQTSGSEKEQQGICKLLGGLAQLHSTSQPPRRPLPSRLWGRYRAPGPPVRQAALWETKGDDSSSRLLSVPPSFEESLPVGFINGPHLRPRAKTGGDLRVHRGGGVACWRGLRAEHLSSTIERCRSSNIAMHVWLRTSSSPSFLCVSVSVLKHPVCLSLCVSDHRQNGSPLSWRPTQKYCTCKGWKLLEITLTGLVLYIVNL